MSITPPWPKTHEARAATAPSHRRLLSAASCSQAEQRLACMGAKLSEAEAKRAALQEQLERAQQQQQQQAARAPPSRPAPLLPSAADGRLDARATSTLIWGAEGSVVLPFASPVASPAAVAAPRGRATAESDADAPLSPAARDQGAASSALAAIAAAPEGGNNKPPGAAEAAAARATAASGNGSSFPGFAALRPSQGSAAAGALGMLSALRDTLASRLLTPAASASGASAPASPGPPAPPRSVADSEDLGSTGGRGAPRSLTLLRDSRSGLADIAAAAVAASTSMGGLSAGGRSPGPASEAGDVAAGAGAEAPASGPVEGSPEPTSPVRTAAGAASAPASAAPAQALRARGGRQAAQARRAAPAAPKPRGPSRRRERFVKAVVVLSIMFAGAAEARPEVVRTAKTRSTHALTASATAARSAWRRLRGQGDVAPAAEEQVPACCREMTASEVAPAEVAPAEAAP
jgi:hypothetical protein